MFFYWLLKKGKDKYIPYPGIPPEKTETMEHCVKEVIAQGKAKENAIAICHDSIMGGKKKKGDHPMNFNFYIGYGDYWKKVAQTDFNGTTNQVIETDQNDSEDNEDPTQKGGEKQNSMEKTKCPECGAMVEKDKMKAHTAEKHPAKKVEDVTPEDKKSDVKLNEPKIEKVEEKKEDKKPAEVEKAGEVSELLKNLIGKIDAVLEKKVDDSAPADGAAPATGDAPKVGEGETPKEDVKDEGASPEGAEKPVEGETEEKKMDKSDAVTSELKKVADSMGKFSETLEKVSGEITEIKDRVSKLEEQPAPSKVASSTIVSKSTPKTSLSPIEEERLAEINKELGNLSHIRDTQLEKYQAEQMHKRAWALIDEKESLLAKKNGV